MASESEEGPVFVAVADEARAEHLLFHTKTQSDARSLPPPHLLHAQLLQDGSSVSAALTSAALQTAGADSGVVLTLEGGNQFRVSVWPPHATRFDRTTQVSYSHSSFGFSLYSKSFTSRYFTHESGVVESSIRGFLSLFPGWAGSGQIALATVRPTLLLSCSKGTGVRSLLHGVMTTVRPGCELIVLALGRLRACGRSRADLLLRQLLMQSCLYASRGAVVYLDGLECCFSSGGEEELGVGELLTVLEEFVTAQTRCAVPVLLVGRVLSVQSLTRRQLALWHDTLVVPPPSLDTRIEVVKALLAADAGAQAVMASAKGSFAQGQQDFVDVLAVSLSGLALAEVVRLSEASVAAFSASLVAASLVLTSDKATASVEASALANSCIGHDEIKSKLDEMLLLPRRCGGLLEKLGLTPETGALLYGPPGTGKTLLVRQLIQRHQGYRLIVLRIVDVIRGEVGAGEKAVVAAFAEAKRVAPSILFIDEFQALFVSRGATADNQDRSFQSLSSTLAGCFDDVCLWNGHAGSSSLVTVIAATNEPWSVDRGFLRPGRFDRLIYVGPLTDCERREFFLQHLNVRANPSVEELVKRTHGYSGADLELLVLNARKHEKDITSAILDALSGSRPTSTSAELRAYHQWEAEIVKTRGIA